MGCCGSKQAVPAANANPNVSYAAPAPVVAAPAVAVAPAPAAARPASAKPGASQPRASHGPDAVNRVRGVVDDKFTVGKELGRGGFSLVKEGINKQTGEKVAIKFIEKKDIDKKELELLEREIKIMEKVKHRNVLRLFEIFETDTVLALVMEFVNGGELFYKIVDRGQYTEKEAKGVVRQLVEGVNYLHSQGVVHRDLKPENLLCSESAEGMEIKIADFGLSKFAVDGLGTSCGTPDYAAPEVLRMDGDYQQSVDLWSVGVITYVILCGFPPFYGNPQSKLFEKILNADYDFPDPEWTYISNEAKDFIRKLLVLDEDARSTAAQCLNHPWLQSAGNDTAAINVNKLKVYNTNYSANR